MVYQSDKNEIAKASFFKGFGTGRSIYYQNICHHFPEVFDLQINSFI